MIRTILQNPIYTGHIVHRGEWIEAQIDPLVTKDAWDTVQCERLKRQPKLDHDHNFLVNLLHDQVGRRMRLLTDGPGRTNPHRYYRSEAAVWSRATEHKATIVRPDDVECLVKSVLSGFFRDRQKLREAVMVESHYSAAIARVLKCGSACARRLDCMNAADYRRALRALTPRIEISSTELTLYLSCRELLRFLAWDGHTPFEKPPVEMQDSARVFPITTAACLVRAHSRHTLPIKPRSGPGARPADELVRILLSASRYREAVYANREKSLLELAQQHGLTQTNFTRTLRLNYLAPDIQMAILDGTLPPGVSRNRLFKAAMVLDWQQQRDLLIVAP